MKKTGAQILIESLLKEKVEVVFGIPGGVFLPTFDALYDSPLRFILTRHEQGAAHMAEGYSRASGGIGVCFATSGPGATNLVTGLANANMDSIPMIAITAQVATNLIGNDAFQEADITGITRPVTKHNYLVKDVRDLARIVKEAFYIAQTGRPGPVLIDLPVDVQKAECDFAYPAHVDIRSYRPNYKGHLGQIRKAAEMINQAQKPVLYIGGGVITSGAHKEIMALAEKAQLPVIWTLMGIGAFPSAHDLSLGMVGMHGTYSANHATQKSDLIIAVGARFDDRVTGRLDKFAPGAKVIHVDIDPTSISKNIKVDVPIVGDARIIIAEMVKSVAKKTKMTDWHKQIEIWKKDFPLTYKKDSKLRAQYVIEQISEITKGNGIITTEVGQNQMWATQFVNCKTPRSFISSGGLGTMGYGFPAAIGAKVACPNKVVFDIAGDGSIQMNIQELATAVQNKIPVKVAILNNGYLGMVRQWQQLFYKRRYSGTVLSGNPDFVKLAEAYGAVGIRVEKKSDVKAAIQKAIKIDKPVFLDFKIEPEENVFPMVPAGAALDEILQGVA